MGIRIIGRPCSITHHSYSQLILEELERRQLFIVPLAASAL
jgi:ATP/maltotriose-dependent transcriptional regulator MalT